MSDAAYGHSGIWTQNSQVSSQVLDHYHPITELIRHLDYIPPRLPIFTEFEPVGRVVSLQYWPCLNVWEHNDRVIQPAMWSSADPAYLPISHPPFRIFTTNSPLNPPWGRLCISFHHTIWWQAFTLHTENLVYMWSCAQVRSDPKSSLNKPLSQEYLCIRIQTVYYTLNKKMLNENQNWLFILFTI